MPIRQRVFIPDKTPKKPKFRLSSIPLIIDPHKALFTTQIDDMVATLPSIGHTEDKQSLLLKHVMPNMHRWARFRGFWICFRPAIKPARSAPAGHYTVIAILVMTPTEQRHEIKNLDMPCCRLDDPDTLNWPPVVAAWIDRIANTYTPAPPSMIEGETFVFS